MELPKCYLKNENTTEATAASLPCCLLTGFRRGRGLKQRAAVLKVLPVLFGAVKRIDPPEAAHVLVLVLLQSDQVVLLDGLDLLEPVCV